MYGTIAKLKVKPGGLEALKAMETRQPPGFIGSYVYQMDANSNELWLVVLFDSKDSYFKNAESPLQNEEFLRLRKSLVEDPEWHDGEVVFSSVASNAT